jgi:triacylglycerol lipase
MQPYPIILAHGIARFDWLTESIWQRIKLTLWQPHLFFESLFDRLHYFNGVATYLKRHDFDVHKTSVRFAASPATRAQDLRLEVERVLAQTGRPKVHIIAHSMGGLDARHMIADLGMAAQVASLTTIGTPHLGTSLADRQLIPEVRAAIALLRPYLDLDGFLALTRADRQAFNERVRHQEASNSVVYQTYTSVQEKAAVFAPLQPSWQLVFDEEGENDGLIPAHSQAWTDLLVSDDGLTKRVAQYHFPFPADHLNQLAWWDLEELTTFHWWRLSLIREKNRYENAVRNIYLQIAGQVAPIE